MVEAPMRTVFLPHEWPDGPLFDAVVDKYREFRLRSLKLAPDAYASTYEREVDFQPEVWRQRLTNPQARHIIIIDTAADLTSSHGNVGNPLLKYEWLGMLVVVESTTRSSDSESKPSWKLNQAVAIAADGNVPRVPHRDCSYQLNGLFVSPSVRRRGLGDALVKSGIEDARASAKQHGLSHADLNIMLDIWNKPARALYGRNGFVDFSEQEFDVGGSSRKALTMICKVECD